MAVAKVGRNDPCWCGGPKKYKYCHWPQAAPRPDSEVPAGSRSLSTLPRVEQSLFQRNVFLLDSIHEIFDVSKAKDWRSIQRTLSDGQVQALYETQATLWPSDTDWRKVAPQPGVELRALYLGDLHPRLVSQNLLRFTLYSDELLVVDPLHNPNCMAEEYNPLARPSQFKFDTLKVLLFLLTLEPWVRAGLVRLVPNPGDFDHALRKETWDLARARVKLGMFDTESGEFRQIQDDAKAQLGRFMATLPDTELRQALLNATPNATDEDVDSAMKGFRRIRRTDPLALDQTIDSGSSGQLENLRMGANLELADFICRATGAFPYTSSQNMWHQLEAEAGSAANPWTELSQAFRELGFRFLNNVDPVFALEMRQAGRLEPMRRYLRDLWTALDAEAPPDELRREFRDRLVDSHAEATADWNQIDRDLASWLGKSVVPAVAAGSTTVAGHLTPLLVAGGWAAAGVTRLLQARMERQMYRQRNPMSVLVDLSRR